MFHSDKLQHYAAVMKEAIADLCSRLSVAGEKREAVNMMDYVQVREGMGGRIPPPLSPSLWLCTADVGGRWMSVDVGGCCYWAVVA